MRRALPVPMAIAPYYWRQARENAPIHLQIRIKKRPGAGSRDSNVAGPVVRIFRDHTGRLKCGDMIAFAVNWRDGRPADKGGPIMLGRQRFAFDLSWLRVARFVEAYLTFDGREFQLLWDQATLLMRQTTQPANPVGGEDYGVLVSEEVTRRAAKKRTWFWPW